MKKIQYLNILSLSLFALTSGLIQEARMPSPLSECFKQHFVKSSLSEYVGCDINWECLQHNAWRLADYGGWNMSASARQWVRELIVQGATENIGTTFTPRVRKEYRLMTEHERDGFHLAINRLKEDTSVFPNMYDSLTAIHQGENIPIAHFGPNFLGWHRVYILLFENALRQKVPAVTLPYWASTLDDEMDDPLQSIIWTRRFLGNGDGIVRSGPFANWQTPSGPLTRNIGNIGELYNNLGVSKILSRRKTADVTQPNRRREHNIELQHNDVHQWVGGQMNGLNTSPQDPVFWLHHAFVDCIWERFRKRQRQNGIDPATDYPASFGDLRHSPNSTMGFGNIRNIDGYSNVFSELVIYEPVPTCTRKNPDCGSKYLSCDIKRIRPLCTSVSDNQFDAPLRGSRNPNSVNDISSCPASVQSLGRPIQNTFLCDNDNDIGKLVYVPIQVVYRRPPEFNQYASFPVVNQRVNYTNDVFSIVNKKSAIMGLQYGNLATFRSCSNTLPATKVFVEANGLNYVGSHREFAVVDNRLGLSTSTSYIAVKDPSNGGVETAVSAFDSCGRMCLPYCKRSNSRGYRRCSGSIRLTSAWPRLYSKYYEDTLFDFWDFDFDSLPDFNEDDVYLKFFCNYDSNDWPWDEFLDTVFNNGDQSMVAGFNIIPSRIPVLTPALQVHSNVVSLLQTNNVPVSSSANHQLARGLQNNRNSIVVSPSSSSVMSPNFVQLSRQNGFPRSATALHRTHQRNSLVVSSAFPRSRQRTVAMEPQKGQRSTTTFRQGCKLGNYCTFLGICGRCTQDLRIPCIGFKNRYTYCTSGRYVVHDCPSGTYFDNLLRMCSI